MKLHILQLPKLVAQRRSTAILGMIIIVMLWTGIIMKYFESVDNDQREAERTNQNLAMLFEENVLRSIGEIDKALLYLRRIVETRGAEGGYDTIYSLVQSSDVLSEIIVQAAIVDNKGIIRWSNALLATAPAISVADREHIKVQLEQHRGSALHQQAGGRPRQRPVVGAVHPAVHAQRRHDRRRRRGVAQSRPLHDLLRQVRPGIVRRGLHDRQRRRHPLVGRQRGRPLLASARTSTAPSWRSISRANGATFEDTDPTTGESRLVSVRPVRGHPLWVSVGINKSDIFKRSAANLRLHAIAGIAADPADPRRHGADPADRGAAPATSPSSCS